MDKADKHAVFDNESKSETAEARLAQSRANLIGAWGQRGLRDPQLTAGWCALFLAQILCTIFYSQRRAVMHWDMKIKNSCVVYKKLSSTCASRPSSVPCHNLLVDCALLSSDEKSWCTRQPSAGSSSGAPKNHLAAAEFYLSQTTKNTPALTLLLFPVEKLTGAF